MKNLPSRKSGIVGCVVAMCMAGACTDIVPREEVRAFEAREMARKTFDELLTHRLYVETDVGTIGIRLYPDDHRYKEQLLDWVAQGAYDGLRFHRADHAPVPFGLQVGDPATRGIVGHDFQWAAEVTGEIPIAGTRAFAEGVSQTHVVEEVRRLDVVLVGRQGSGTIGPHLFVVLGGEIFMDDSYAVVGSVVSGASVLDSVQVGTKVQSVQWLPARKALPELSLPAEVERRIEAARPK